MADIATVAGLRDGAKNSRIVEFLTSVQWTTAGIASGMIVRYKGVVVANRADDVTLHYLHVINIVKQTEVGRIESAA